jgi:hypothetical protein
VIRCVAYAGCSSSKLKNSASLLLLGLLHDCGQARDICYAQLVLYWDAKSKQGWKFNHCIAR